MQKSMKIRTSKSQREESKTESKDQSDETEDRPVSRTLRSSSSKKKVSQKRKQIIKTPSAGSRSPQLVPVDEDYETDQGQDNTTVPG